MKIIYLDNNATTKIAPEVYEEMIPYFTEDYFNPSSMYDAARETGRAVAVARKSIAECLGNVDTKEVLFTGCATESNNTAILGAARANPNRRHIITTAVEHPAVLEVCKELERDGYK
ncbi:MAG: aminotransferase class V-fold PLP-dependent enzyme, partial [Anaerolineae bacterium]